MRRSTVWALSVVVVAAGCSSSDRRAAPPGSTSATTPALTATTACAFTPVPEGGEVTWVDGDRLVAVAPGGGERRCLVAGVGGAGPLQWSGDGTRALVGNTLRTAGGVQREFARPFGLRLSRPTGRSVIELGGERLRKYEAGAGDARDITFVERPVEALYHPAGRSIVASGTQGGRPAVVIADNLGRDPKVLAAGETASGFSSLAFTASNALLFVGHHDGAQHLHRLELASGTLTTVATEAAPGQLGDVTTSAFPGGGVAWTRGAGGCDLVVEQDARFVDVAGTPVASARPVGWLPDRSLVVTTGCGDPSGVGDVYVVAAGAPPRLLASKVAGAVAVRAVLPPPAEPPAAVPDQAPA